MFYVLCPPAVPVSHLASRILLSLWFWKRVRRPLCPNPFWLQPLTPPSMQTDLPPPDHQQRRITVTTCYSTQIRYTLLHTMLFIYDFSCIYSEFILGINDNRALISQNAVVYSTRVHALGRYVFILHYHQPLHPTYNIQVYINGGRIWQGEQTCTDRSWWIIRCNRHCFNDLVFILGHANASFCPHGYGCRSVVMAENQIILDVTDHEVILTLRAPDRRTLWLVSGLLKLRYSFYEKECRKCTNSVGWCRCVCFRTMFWWYQKAPTAPPLCWRNHWTNLMTSSATVDRTAFTSSTICKHAVWRDIHCVKV